MFVDEETEAFLKNASAIDESKRSGLWRIVVARNLPYADPRRTGKVIYLIKKQQFEGSKWTFDSWQLAL